MLLCLNVMAEEEITKIYCEIFANDLLYCGVCLRTERERRLVEPVFYRKCIKFQHLHSPDHSALRTCVVCEAHARRAFYLYSAASFAAVIDGWFQSIPKRLRYFHDLSYDLNRIAKNSKFEELPLSEYWRVLRSRTELHQTDILNTCNKEMEDEEKVDIADTATPTASSPMPPSSPVPTPPSSPVPTPPSSPVPPPSSPVPTPPFLVEVTSFPEPSHVSSPAPSHVSSPAPSRTPSPVTLSTSSPVSSPTSCPVPSPTASPVRSPSVSPVPNLMLTISPTSTPSPTNLTPAESPEPVTSQQEPFLENDVLSDADSEEMVIIVVAEEDKIQTTTVATQTENRSPLSLVPMSTLLTQQDVYNVAILPNQPFFLSRDGNNNDSFLFHPAHVMPDGNYYVPSLNAYTNAVLLPAPEIFSKSYPPFDSMYKYVRYLRINDKLYKLRFANIENTPVRYSPSVMYQPVVDLNSPPVKHDPTVSLNNPVANDNSSPVKCNPIESGNNPPVTYSPNASVNNPDVNRYSPNAMSKPVINVNSPPVKHNPIVSLNSPVANGNSSPVKCNPIESVNNPPVTCSPNASVNNPAVNRNSSVVILSNVLVNSPPVSEPLISVGGMQFVLKPKPVERPLVPLCLRPEHSSSVIDTESVQQDVTSAPLDWLNETPINADWADELPIDMI